MGIPINNVPRRVVFAASGTGPYAFTFEILAAADIAVYKDDVLLTLTTNYTVTINANGTLAAKSPATVTAGTAMKEIAITPNGATLYATSEGGNALFQYAIGAGGALTALSPASISVTRRAASPRSSMSAFASRTIAAISDSASRRICSATIRISSATPSSVSMRANAAASNPRSGGANA